MRSFLLAGLFGLTLIPAQARLGETLDQCTSRYGTITGSSMNSDGNKTADYQKNGIIIGITFVNGRAELEDFVKSDGSEFSDTELKGLLDADSGSNNSWLDSTNSNDVKAWIREDNAVAAYSKSLHYLTLETQEYVELQKAKKKASESKTLNGF
jgi:hypothetical protein